ncbi:MAG: hypothetical protein WCV41_01750 [Patescibacteria group bacterium]
MTYLVKYDIILNIKFKYILKKKGFSKMMHLYLVDKGVTCGQQDNNEIKFSARWKQFFSVPEDMKCPNCLKIYQNLLQSGYDEKP